MISLGTLMVDLDALDHLAGWLESTATAHDEAGGVVRSAVQTDWSGDAATTGNLAQDRWEVGRRRTADDLRTLAGAARAASRAYGEAGQVCARMWAQVG